MLSVMLRRSSNELKLTSLMQRRNIFSFFRRTTEKQYRIKDKVDTNYSIIYKAPMENYLAACNQVTTLSVLPVAGFAIYRYIHRFEPPSTEMVFLENTGNFAAIAEAETAYFVMGLVMLCIMFRIILYKYPLRIYRDHTKYIAVFEGQLPLTKVQFPFIKGEVKELPPDGIMPWKEHRYMIKDRSTIMFYECFSRPIELFSMQQPIKDPKKALK